MDFERENSGIVVNKGLRLQKNNWGKWFYTSNDLILDIVMSHRKKIFRILAESFKQGCKYCILRVEINNLRKNIFYWNKLSISIYFRILRKKILDIQRKKNQDFQNCIQHVRIPRCMKKCFFWISYNFCMFVRTARNTFESLAKNSLVGSPNCMYVSKWKVRTKWLFFEPFKFKFFPDFERKISSSVMKT